MSFVSKLFKGVTSVGKAIISSPTARALAPILGGPIGATITAASTAYGAYQMMKPPVSGVASVPIPSPSKMSYGAPAMSMQSGMFPSSYGPLLGLGGAAVGGAVRAGGMVVAGAKTVMRSAQSYCRKHPTWCSTIGGVAAVEALISSGQLPPVKARRGRGITATELKNFKRVARFTSKYCAPVRKAMSSRALRGKSCR